MSIEHDMKVMSRYIDAMKSALPDGWHFVTVMMMQDPDEPDMHRIRVHCDREPTSLPCLLRRLADDLEAQAPPPQVMETH